MDHSITYKSEYFSDFNKVSSIFPETMSAVSFLTVLLETKILIPVYKVHILRGELIVIVKQSLGKHQTNGLLLCKNNIAITLQSLDSPSREFT